MAMPTDVFYETIADPAMDESHLKEIFTQSYLGHTGPENTSDIEKIAFVLKTLNTDEVVRNALQTGSLSTLNFLLTVMPEYSNIDYEKLFEWAIERPTQLVSVAEHVLEYSQAHSDMSDIKRRMISAVLSLNNAYIRQLAKNEKNILYLNIDTGKTAFYWAAYAGNHNFIFSILTHRQPIKLDLQNSVNYALFQTAVDGAFERYNHFKDKTPNASALYALLCKIQYSILALGSDVKEGTVLQRRNHSDIAEFNSYLVKALEYFCEVENYNRLNSSDFHKIINICIDYSNTNLFMRIDESDAMQKRHHKAILKLRARENPNIYPVSQLNVESTQEIRSDIEAVQTLMSKKTDSFSRSLFPLPQPTDKPVKKSSHFKHKH